MIEVLTLGIFSICDNKKVVRDRLGSRGREFTAFVAVNAGRSHRREWLMEMIWGDLEEAKARRSMNTAVWKLRKIIDQHAGDSRFAPLRSEAGCITFQTSDQVTVDAADFATSVSDIWSRYKTDPVELNESIQTNLSTALELYRGPFLEQCDADWAVAVRHDMESLYVRGMMVLKADFTRKRQYENAIDCGTRILRVDPHRETAQRDLMRLYVVNGQQARAIKQYQHCRRMLAEEFDVSPMPHTAALYEQIKKGEFPSMFQENRLIIEAL